MATKPIGERIRDERKRRRMTQSDLGDCLRVAGNTVARWERGEMEPLGLYRLAVERWLSEEVSA